MSETPVQRSLLDTYVMGAMKPVQRSLLDTYVMGAMKPVRGKVDTSQAAAESVRNSVGPKGALVLHHIMNQRENGATADEIQKALGMDSQSVTPRCRELRELGLIEWTDAKRPTAKGRPAHVCFATPLAWQLERTLVEQPQTTPTPAHEPRSESE